MAFLKGSHWEGDLPEGWSREELESWIEYKRDIGAKPWNDAKVIDEKLD